MSKRKRTAVKDTVNLDQSQPERPNKKYDIFVRNMTANLSWKLQVVSPFSRVEDLLCKLLLIENCVLNRGYPILKYDDQVLKADYLLSFYGIQDQSIILMWNNIQKLKNARLNVHVEKRLNGLQLSLKSYKAAQFYQGKKRIRLLILKNLIHDHEGIPECQQDLFLDEKKLEDNAALTGNPIHLTVKKDSNNCFCLKRCSIRRLEVVVSEQTSRDRAEIPSSDNKVIIQQQNGSKSLRIGTFKATHKSLPPVTMQDHTRSHKAIQAHMFSLYL